MSTIRFAWFLVLPLILASCVAQVPTDFPFRTSSILRHENGQMKRACLIEPTEIDELPCRSWCWWYEDGRVDNIELAEPVSLSGHDLPAGTRVFFDREGRIAHLWLAEDTVIDGRLCRGRWKIDTALHPNNRIKAFFPREDTEIDGVLCEASLFHPIYLHPDGKLKQCKLAGDITLAGESFAKGSTIALDAAGLPAARH
jgi:hypothetical protein